MNAVLAEIADRSSKLLMVREYLRDHGRQIRRIANMGDKEAIIFEANYRAWWSHPLDEKIQRELIHVWEQFLLRDLTETERVILQNRFGYKVPT